MAFDWFRRKFNANDDKGKDSEPKANESQAPAETDEADSGDAGGDKTRDGEENEDYLEFAKAAFQNIKAQQAIAEDSDTADSATAEPNVPEPETPELETPEPETPEPEVELISPGPESTTETVIPDPAATEAEPAQVAETVTEEAEPEIQADVTPELAIAAPEEIVAEPEIAESLEESQPETDEPTTTEPEGPVVAEAPAESVPEAIALKPDPSEIPPTPVTPEPEPVSAHPTTPEPEAVPEPAPALAFLARAEAEREERLERLQATAIEEPEPEPEPEEEYVDESYGPGVVFDEDFIWSAEVLAAQGRRPDQISAEEITWLKRLRQGLGKTRLNLINQLKSIVGQGPLNDEAVDEIESLLLQADVGVDATDYIIESLQAKLKEEVLPPAQAIAYLKRLLRELLDSPISENDPPVLAPEKDRLNIWLMTGVNGAGKTTTIGKLAHLATKSDYRCLIAAADTFRAAAVQQVQVWGDRSGIEVIANPGQNTDPAAVVYDAVEAARSRNTELLLVDTAGRLQNKKNLMAELSKVRRIIDKKAPEAKVESLLVLDATLGQNGLRQAEVFAQAAELSGVVLTKLDGTARGGVALAVVKQLGLPIRFIGAGEGIGDLRPFSSYEFIEALLSG